MKICFISNVFLLFSATGTRGILHVLQWNVRRSGTIWDVGGIIHEILLLNSFFIFHILFFNVHKFAIFLYTFFLYNFWNHNRIFSYISLCFLLFLCERHWHWEASNYLFYRPSSKKFYLGFFFIRNIDVKCCNHYYFFVLIFSVTEEISCKVSLLPLK